ncbi:oxidoreductase [Dongshaea marina]|uniref:oxidoreductase n=1 Tax=Dongshaea marina TaxID=2047966 RepID=UPI000D3E86D6|nr:HisA/HisF-related TIM barrel protein [Dongshaea marina]
MPSPTLFSPFSFANGKKAGNRIALAPMTTTLSQPDGSISALDLKWLQSFREGGFGVITTPVSYISTSGQGWPNQMAIDQDENLPGLTTLARTINTDNNLSIIQIGHNGSRSPAELIGQQPVSSSAFTLDIPGFEQPRALGLEEIASLTQAYARAVERAYQAGFDGAELHFANGYLITQFLSTQTNLRQDCYGGTLENRARFAREVVQACRAKVPHDFIIGARLSPEGPGLDLDESVQTALWLKADGLDFVHLSQLDASMPPTKYPDAEQMVVHYFRNALGEDYPIFVAGGITSKAKAQRVLQAGASFVALGRIALGNPDWPQRIREQLPVLEYPYRQQDLISRGIPRGVIDYCNTYIAAFGIMEPEPAEKSPA